MPYASEAIGVEVSVHHCRQGKGNNKLYIRRTNDGRILAYCFHCGERGVASENNLRLFDASRLGAKAQERPISNAHVTNGTASTGVHYEDQRHTSEASERGIHAGVFQYPKDARPLGNRIPKEVTLWLMKYGVTWKDCSDYGILYSDTMGLILPMYNNGRLVGYQSRKFPQGTPKYLTWLDSDFKKLKNRQYDLIKAQIPDPNIVVIVEDYISAIRISKAGYNAHCLYGSNFTRPQSKARTIIWLDNDNKQIKLKQTKILAELSQFNIESCIIKESDPKHYSTEQIQEFINGTNS